MYYYKILNGYKECNGSYTTNKATLDEFDVIRLYAMKLISKDEMEKRLKELEPISSTRFSFS